MCQQDTKAGNELSLFTDNLFRRLLSVLRSSPSAFPQGIFFRISNMGMWTNPWGHLSCPPCSPLMYWLQPCSGGAKNYYLGWVVAAGLC